MYEDINMIENWQIYLQKIKHASGNLQHGLYSGWNVHSQNNTDSE